MTPAKISGESKHRRGAAAPPADPPSPWGRAAVAVATCGGLGYWPWAPATLTSAVVTLAVYLVGDPGLLGDPGAIGLVGLGVLVALLGVYVAGVAERTLGHDAGPITIDEVAGMLLSLAAAPRTAAGYLLAFFLFRVLDVVKPPPAYALQRLPGGLGVVADDVAAGLYAAALLLVPRLLGLDLPWLFGTS